MWAKPPSQDKPKLSTWLMVWGQFVFIVVALTAVRLLPSAAPQREIDPLTEYVTFGLGGLALVSSLFVWVAAQQLAADTDADLRRFQTQSLITMALAELPTLLAFVLLLGAPPGVYLALPILSGVVLVLVVLPTGLRFWADSGSHR